MGINNEIQLWAVTSIMMIGLLIFFIGVWILIRPEGFLKASKSLGRWISTDAFFESLDRPRYQERFIYKHHRIAGLMIITGAAYTLFMMYSKVDMQMFVAQLPQIGTQFWTEWLYGVVYILLISANLMALLLGLIVLIRPSTLKVIEKYLNKWVVTGQDLKKLDQTHEIALEVLPGNPRLFGLAVTLGGIYIVISMAIMLF
jgi:hypothetical protein